MVIQHKSLDIILKNGFVLLLKNASKNCFKYRICEASYKFT